MDESEMDFNDLLDAAPRKEDFKTPMPVKCKILPLSLEESGYHSSSSSHINSSAGSWTFSSIHSNQNSSSQNSLFPINGSSNDSLFSSPESSMKNLNIPRSLETSPDSAIGSDSVFSDEPTPRTPPSKRPAAPELPTSSLRVETVFSEDKSSHALWQSTPLYANDKNIRPSFSEDCFEKSPTKRRRAALRKPSRDLFAADSPRTSSVSDLTFVGAERVDFLFYLGKQSSFQPALEIILGHLQPADLCRASIVSQSWKNVIESVPSARHRKQVYIDRCAQIKENLHQSSKKTEGVLPFRGQLLDILNFNRTEEFPSPSPRSPPVSPSKVRFNLYLKEGRKLGDGQTLVQCPMCTLPSRKETDKAARCTRRGCQFYFCILCLCKFHGGKPCPVSAVRHRKRITSIGSRESRRNLQRL
ncbi:F-box only protein 43 [Frankliniella fusca]|uniref:F-box only protein 43 n=1 Tax=Frankliniella fusca TaxID=407009 RepID=A0AAE1HRI9_9NEOP|nr:F-box only protein 43 [Frankliniella fusca]